MIPTTPLQIQTFETFPTFEDFIAQLKPANLLLMYDDINTIDESISEIRLTLEDINNLYTDGKTYPAIDYIILWLENINVFTNISKPLVEKQPVAIMIYKGYKHFYLTDLKVLFEKIMRKEYGPFYGSVDAQIIISSFEKYNYERKKIKADQETVIRDEMQKKIDKLFNSTRPIVSEEFKAKYGDQNLNIGRDILAETFKRMETERQQIREDYFNKYGIR